MVRNGCCRCHWLGFLLSANIRPINKLEEFFHSTYVCDTSATLAFPSRYKNAF
jgi:hypothetical protein